MSGTAGTHSESGFRSIDIIVSIVVFFVLAVAQPLLDLLGRNAEFFLARSAPALDIVLLAVLLTIVIPMGIALLVVWVYRIHRPTGVVVHGIILAVLAGVLALQILEALPLADMAPWLEITLALLVGGGVVYAFHRFEAMRSAARFASIAPAIVLGLFVFASSVSQLVFSAPAIAQPVAIPVDNPAPVVFIVFDEFPVSSLMDEDGNIEADVYPSFAKLAEDGTWYRNAITVQQQTEDSVPVILSGRHAQDDKIPTAGDHPFTLFTLLDDAYELEVIETVTDLCPEYACENATRPQYSFKERWATLLDDLRIVAGHLFLPNDMTAELPPIDASWSNFSGGSKDGFDIIDRFVEATDNDGRITSIDRFMDSISSSNEQPTLYYLHELLPHVPWEYLPTGQRFTGASAAPGSVSPGWGSDEWLVSQGYQRHLLNVGYTDKVLGDIVDTLEDEGLYDDALIVVLADHGVAVKPDVYHRREALDDTVGDIAAIPLFIKVPHDEGGVVDDYRAETTDVLPTVADVLGVSIPWTTDGVSLLAVDRPVRTQSQIEGTKGTVTFGVDGSEALALAENKIELFGDGGPFGLAPPGFRDLLGTEVADLDVIPASGFSAVVSKSTEYDDVDTDAEGLPTWVRGHLRTPADEYEHHIVAIGVNGRIEAVTRTLETEKGATLFGAMVPPESLVDGKNEIEVLLVVGHGTDRSFRFLNG